MNKIVIYTCMSGDILPQEPAYISSDCDYICFTTDPDAKSNSWTMRLIDGVSPEECLDPKIRPHLHLAEYDYSIYVAPELLIRDDLNRLAQQVLANRDMALFIDPDIGRSVRTEAQICIRQCKDNDTIISKQLDFYEESGVLLHAPIHSFDLILRRHNAPELIPVMEEWFTQVNTYTALEQLSYSYAAHKHDFAHFSIKLDVHNNKYLTSQNEEEELSKRGKVSPDALAAFIPRRILICQLNQLGDVLLTTPAIELLKERYPDAEIDIFTEKKCLPVLENNPHINEVIAVDKKVHNSLIKELKFAWQTARRGYDLVIDFQQLPRIRPVVLFSFAKLRLTYTPKSYKKALYNAWIDMFPGYSGSSKASVLRPLGINWDWERPKLYISDDEKARAKEILAENNIGADDILITLDPTHRRDTRRWPAKHFAEMIGLVAKELPRVKFLLLHGPGEEAEVQAVIDSSTAPENCVLPEKMLTLREMAAVIEQADMHMGNCSAPRHFAVAVDTPTITVLGATSSSWTFPGNGHQHFDGGAPCQPCNKNSCATGKMECLENIRPQAVAERILTSLKK
ncbi:MAG: glycosyltransferase family 9 protein [Desulfovibrio sp.]